MVNLLLAFRAVVCAPSADHDLLYRRFADQAWFAFAAIGTMLQLEEPGFAIGINVIRN
jgi:hypothetical protein